tara:strand:+ start:367 stop:798 length:432 start_codon:yes stop_codon:yes gene_type:complete
MWVGTRRQFNGLIIGGIAMMITKNFSVAEMGCSCCGKADMDEDFMRILQSIRDEMKRPLQITSGYRCEKHNSVVSKVKNGPHTKAKAADILISGADALRLFAIAQKHGVSGCGLSQNGPHNKRFLHIDSLTSDEGPRPTVWTY